MTVLAFVSRWLLGGGWKIAGLAFGAIAAGLLFASVVHWKNQAAYVPLLTAQIADTEKRAGIVLARLSEAENRRGAAEAALSAWQSTRSATLEPIRESGRHATAANNSVCLPSAADRGMRNDAIKQLLGRAGSASDVPTAAVTPQ